MAKCVCGNEMNRKDWKSQWVCNKCGRTKPIYECMTNADRIRSMTDEELTEIVSLGVVDCRTCEEPQNEEGVCSGRCRNELLRWLKSEVGCE